VRFNKINFMILIYHSNRLIARGGSRRKFRGFNVLESILRN